jgi:hypothetical protein
MNRNEILKAAIEAVTDRGRKYGEPEDAFGRIAVLWNGWMGIRKGGDLTGVDVAIMMVLFKLGRIAGGVKHPDNFVDAAGYAACGGELSGDDNKE